jgi:hypothetical protein
MTFFRKSLLKIHTEVRFLILRQYSRIDKQLLSELGIKTDLCGVKDTSSDFLKYLRQTRYSLGSIIVSVVKALTLS